MTEPENRRLAAIMMLDVAGFSRMMAADESGTLARVLDIRQAVLDPAIQRHQGRLVKMMGDGALIEFVSVSAAVQCAIEIQEQMRVRTDDPPVQLRIGINLGEVIVQDNDIYGDGINVTSRIEALAKPGGIAISRAVYEQVRQRFQIAFVDGGAHAVKNIAKPVQIYHLHNDAAQSGPKPALRRWRWPVAAALAVLIAAGALLLLRVTPFSGPETVAVAPAIPSEKPSIAVLPFANLSGDVGQSYFSDGISENLITDLSRISGLLVIARNTSFSFRDTDMDARAIGTELGVRYVVQGSVQKAGDSVRIHANLVDTISGYQVWAGRFDREFTDLFALQDEVTADVTTALQVKLTEEERRLLAKRYTNSLEAYDLYLRAYEEIWRFNDESRRASVQLLEQAIRIDPGFALAKALMATGYTNRTGASLLGVTDALDRAYKIASDAVQLDPDLPQVHSALGLVQMFRREYQDAEISHSRAIALDPNFADGYAMRAWNRLYAGEPQQALDSFEEALKRNPRPPFPYLNALAEIHFGLGNYQKALDLNREAVRRNPNGQRIRLFLAATYAMLGDQDSAEWEIQELLLLEPDVTISLLGSIAPYDQEKSDIFARLVQGARLAGLPE